MLNRISKPDRRLLFHIRVLIPLVLGLIFRVRTTFRRELEASAHTGREERTLTLQ